MVITLLGTSLILSLALVPNRVITILFHCLFLDFYQSLCSHTDWFIISFPIISQQNKLTFEVCNFGPDVPEDLSLHQPHLTQILEFVGCQTTWTWKPSLPLYLACLSRCGNWASDLLPLVNENNHRINNPNLD